MKYPKNSAARIMLDKKFVPTAKKDETLSEIRDQFQEKISGWKTINYVYIIDDERLVGVVSIRDVFKKKKTIKVSKVMVRDLVRVFPDQDQEEVAYLALRNNIKSVPVVAKDNVFLGVVPSDKILFILYQELGEDILMHAGIAKEDKKIILPIDASIKTLVRARTPWLILGLLGGILAVGVVESFGVALKSYLTLAAFIPVMVYMADAVGTQTQTLFIRSLALDSRLAIKRYFLREMKIGFIIAFISGFSLALITFFWKGNSILGLIVGLSLLITCLVAVFIAVLVPLILKRLRFDPAVGSGPFSTIVRDILSLIIYFEIASLLLHLLL